MGGPPGPRSQIAPEATCPYLVRGRCRVTSPCVHPTPPSRGPASGSWITALAFPAPFEVSASDPGRKTSGRPSSEEATPEAVQTGAGDLGRPGLSGYAPSLGMRAGPHGGPATRSPSALPLLAAFRPGTRAPSRSPHPLSRPPRRGAGRRGTLAPRDGGGGSRARTQHAPLWVGHGLGTGTLPRGSELDGLGQEMAPSREAGPVLYPGGPPGGSR